jgi:DNA-binding GntR family transcriptional regulator
MSDDSFRPISPNTLRNSATETIRRAIIEGILLPGEQVNQAQIAEKLGISRGPIREALSQLDKEGLIRNVPYKGTFVTEVTPTYIEELYSIRRVLEGFAVRCLIERANPQDLEELRTIVAEMQEAANATDAACLSELDLRFHHLICRSAHHDLLMQMWESIEIGVRRFLILRHRIYEDPHDIVGTHPDILAAIEARDVDRASQFLDAHIQEAGELLYRFWSARASAESHGHPNPVATAVHSTLLQAIEE